MYDSPSTDKLALLTECANRTPDHIKRRTKAIKVTWVKVGDPDDYAVCPNVEIELYPEAPLIEPAAPFFPQG